METTHLLLCLL